MDRDVVDHCQPVGIPEFCQWLSIPKLLQVVFNLMPPGCALGNQVNNLCVSGLGPIEPSYQAIIAFLVVSLIKGDMGVLFDAFLDETGSDIDFCFQLKKFTVKGTGVEALG
ncbi:MAG: hypothetical protein J1E40_12020 [Oscillospiraceae bacterium]|nr:hypothetical protein [Oscillospiraceae bacterium]